MLLLYLPKFWHNFGFNCRLIAVSFGLGLYYHGGDEERLQRMSEALSTGKLTARTTLLNKYAYHDVIYAKPGTNKGPASPIHVHVKIFTTTHRLLMANHVINTIKACILVGQANFSRWLITSSLAGVVFITYATALAVYSWHVCDSDCVEYVNSQYSALYHYFRQMLCFDNLLLSTSMVNCFVSFSLIVCIIPSLV